MILLRYFSFLLISHLVQWEPTKLVHMTLGNTSVLCTSLVGAHCIDQNPGRPETDISPIFVDVID